MLTFAPLLGTFEKSVLCGGYFILLTAVFLPRATPVHERRRETLFYFLTMTSLGPLNFLFS